MHLSSMRCVVAGVGAALALVGCRSHSPFDQLVRDGDVATAPAMTTSGAAGPADEAPSEPVEPASDRALPVLDASADLDDYLRHAALNNPGLEARFQDWQAALERLPQVSALPDPRLTYGYYIGEVETRVGPMRHQVALSQTFPWFGKLQDREDAAARDADAAFQRLEAARLELFLRVERAYNELFFLGRSIDITRDNIELLQQFERVTRTRYRVATAGHPDIIKIQVELGTIEDRLRRMESLRTPHVARLNAALSRPAEADVPWPSAISQRVTDDAASDLLATLRARSPELAALQEESERERVNSTIARKDGLPDFTVGLAYTVVDERNSVDLSENGDDAVLATLSVNLPIWREKYDAGVREALARRLAVAGERGEVMNRLESELQEALFEHHDARRRVELYRATLIPKAKESLQASLGSFEQGASDFFDLIDAQRTLLEFQLALERALVDRATTNARIEQLAGIGGANLPPATKEPTR